jgi:tetratricopeptide (TPR) repeat protein
VAPRRVERPKTAAEARSAEVKAARGPREPREQAAPPPWEREQWVDDGPLRSAARKASERAQQPDVAEAVRPPRGRRKSVELAPEVAEELQHKSPAARAAKYRERLATAADALDRGRFDDARRMVQPVLRDLPDMAFGHEIAGLAFYRTGQWRKAIAELEVARELDRSLNHHAVLADCYRALKRYDMVDKLWLELREGSPEPALMAEGRIVAAGALADRGDLKGALKLMERAAETPKKIRDHHLRQWYVLGDLHDRSGDVIKARRFFGMIVETDAQFADAVDRLRSLGR